MVVTGRLTPGLWKYQYFLMKWIYKNVQHLDPLIPKSDKYLISPHNITPESNIYVTRIKEMITN